MEHRDPSDVSSDIPSMLAGLAAIQPDNAAILAPGREPLSFSALYDQLQYVRDALAACNIQRGDPVAVLLPKGPEMAVALATLPASATAIPLDPNLTVEEYRRLFHRCGAKALLLPHGQEHAARAAAGRAGLLQIDAVFRSESAAGLFELCPSTTLSGDRDGRGVGEEIAYILSTSGTTSERKLIPRTHRSVIVHAETSKAWLALDATDVSLHLTPMYFGGGVNTATMAPLLSGGATIFPPGYTPEILFSLLEEYHPTWLGTGFTILRDILRHAEGYSEILAQTRLRFIRAYSGRLEPDEIERLQQLFNAPFVTGLNSTETGCIAGIPLPPGILKIGSAGLPLADDVRIRDEFVGFMEAGETGEVVVRSPMVFDGYLDDPESTEQAFHDGWYRTGDLGYFDENGYLFLIGRIKDVINCGGVKISPAEIDGVLESHPAVAEAAAFGMPHPSLGEIVVAAIVPATGADPDERDIKRHVGLHLAGPKIPRKIYVVDRLPRTDSGKLQRRKLLEIIARL